LAHAGFGSAGKFYFLSLFVKQLGPWIGCVFHGNHKVHRANKALKQLRFAFLSYLSIFFTTAANLLQATTAFVLKIFSFSYREKVLGDAFDRHCWDAACCSIHLSNWWPAGQMWATTLKFKASVYLALLEQWWFIPVYKE